jgi:integrase
MDRRHSGHITCRYGCATMLFAAGMNIEQVQEWLGHKSPLVTRSTYARAIPGDKESCANTLDNIHAAPADDNVRALLA